MEKGKRLYESFKIACSMYSKASGSTKRLDGGKYAVCHVLLSMDRRSDRTFLCGSVECKRVAGKLRNLLSRIVLCGNFDSASDLCDRRDSYGWFSGYV